MGETGVKSLESNGQDLSEKFGSHGVWCHVHSLGFLLQGTVVKVLHEELQSKNNVPPAGR